MTNPSGGGGLVRQAINVTPSTAYTFSFYAKRGTASDAKYSVYDSTNGGDIISPTSYYSQINSDTFTRITVSFIAPIGCTSLAVYIIRDSLAVGNTIVWGAQVEQNSYATSYIPTNGSTVTRLKDAAFGSGNSDLINSTEGVLYFEGSALTNETDVNKTIGISNVSSSNRVQLTLHGTPSRISFYGTSSEGFALSYSNFSYNKTEPLKIAVKWKIGDVGIFINGIKVYTGTPANTFLSNTLNTLSFADYNNVGSPFYGKTKCLAVFKEALTDEELECLTTDETSYSSFTALALANNYTII